MQSEDLVALVNGLVWPMIAIGLLVRFRGPLSSSVELVLDRIARGDEIQTPWLTLGKSAGQIKKPSSSELITDDHLGLIHRSWRCAERDADFGGQKMYQIHVIVFGVEAALDRVEHVVYRLDPVYPHPVRRGGPRETKFELRELANGYSLVRADVKIKNQEELVYLSRFIDLVEESPPLKGTYL